MTKKILVLSYSQTGQATNIARSFADAFKDDECHFEYLQPATPFPFPWSTFDFFNAFPETFSQKKIALKPFSANTKKSFDLVVMAYQPWFLTPSPTVSSFLQTDEAKELLNGKPVITLIGSRNMWLGAQEKVKRHLLKAGANLVGNIALVDRTDNVKSVVTILRWMLTGKKEAFWIFPPAGVSDADIRHMVEYGKMTKAALDNNELDSLQQKLNDAGAIDVKPNLILLEKRGQKAFGIWSKFIGSADPNSLSRTIRVRIFSFLLPTAVFILSPLLALLSTIMLMTKRAELEAMANQFKQNKPVDVFNQ